MDFLDLNLKAFVLKAKGERVSCFFKRTCLLYERLIMNLSLYNQTWGLGLYLYPGTELV